MKKLQYVLVTTSFRGVFAGKLVEDGGDVVELAEARNCIRWSTDCKGFLGLAVSGPSSGCRIGPAAERLVLRGVTSISAVSNKARQRWEAAPWAT